MHKEPILYIFDAISLTTKDQTLEHFIRVIAPQLERFIPQ